jgi:hypothetical protein
MENTSEMLGATRPTTQYYIPEDWNPEAVLYSLKTFSDYQMLVGLVSHPRH